MADNISKTPCLDDENSSSGDSLDFSSSRFDPLKALYAKNIKVPVPEAPVYDNLAIFTAKLNAGALGRLAGKTVTDKVDKKKARETEIIVKNKERFLPHQMPVKSERVFYNRNIFTKIENMTGPLACLKKCMDTRIRIKVVTRNEKEVRGYCIGYLQAFDKMWNLAMSDVLEVWTRKTKRKVPAAMDDHELSKQIKRLSIRRIAIPQVTVKPAGKGLETCQRHVPQLMMRGEHVVLIELLNVKPKTKQETEKTKVEIEAEVAEAGSQKTQSNVETKIGQDVMPDTQTKIKEGVS